MKRIFWATVAFVALTSLGGPLGFFGWLWALFVYLVVFEVMMRIFS